VIRSFADAATEDLFNGVNSRRARAACPHDLWPVVRRKLTQLINQQYRVCFRWEAGYADEVEVTDYH